jgi:acyl carrier protein
MASRGARHIAVLARSGVNTQEKLGFIEQAAQDGVEIQMSKCDIGVKEQLSQVFCQLSAERPVKGVIHAAMVLAVSMEVSILAIKADRIKDKLFTSLTFEEWRRGLFAKCTGAINLHEVTLHMPLDFFIMTTSLSNHVGHVTQTAYSAANNFQDAFARYRRRLGLPACAIALGLITEISELGHATSSQNAMSRINLYGTGEHEFLSCIEAAFHAHTEANIITCLEPSKILQKEEENNQQSRGSGAVPRWYSDARFSHVRRAMMNIAEDNESSAGQFGSGPRLTASAEEVDRLLAGSQSEEALQLVMNAVIARIADMLFMSIEGIEKGKSVSDYGVDSLIAAELRNWLVSTYKCEISFLKLLDGETTIAGLAELVVSARRA